MTRSHVVKACHLWLEIAKKKKESYPESRVSLATSCSVYFIQKDLWLRPWRSFWPQDYFDFLLYLIIQEAGVRNHRQLSLTHIGSTATTLMHSGSKLLKPAKNRFPWSHFTNFSNKFQQRHVIFVSGHFVSFHIQKIYQTVVRKSINSQFLKFFNRFFADFFAWTR